MEMFTVRATAATAAKQVKRGLEGWETTRPAGRIQFHFDRDRVCVVTALSVEESARRKGIATRLVHEMCAFLRRRRIWRIELDNMTDPGNDFYPRLGFVWDEVDAEGVPGGPEMSARTHVVLRRSGRVPLAVEPGTLRFTVHKIEIKKQ